MTELVGTASDDVPEILAIGSSGISTVFISMSERHPEGRDADYVAWHTLDHRPEQHRMPALRASLRLVSTPACRSARAASDARFDAVDHIQNYFFADLSGLDAFNDLNATMRDVGRTPYLLPLVERGVFELAGTAAAPRIKVGADVLPWWPARGVYFLIEEGAAPATDLVAVPGVGGAWWATAVPVDPLFASPDQAGLQITYCFLDEDPVESAERLRPELEKRWIDGAPVPLLAAPFELVVPYDFERHLP